MDELLKVAPGTGSYVSESNYFEPQWQRSFWGSNYAKLAAVKQKYDPDGLFFVHHGVGQRSVERGWVHATFVALIAMLNAALIACAGGEATRIVVKERSAAQGPP